VKTLLAAIVAGLIAAAASAAPSQVMSAFHGLSADELATLGQGRALIRQAPSSRSLSLAAPGSFADEIRSRVRSLGANYIGEVIMVVPQSKSSSGFLPALAKDLENVEGFVGIPYWSKQNNRTYDLFDRVKIMERSTQPGGQSVVVDQHMEPFADYTARYSSELDGAELRFRSENMTTISYKGFDAVAPGNMVWYLYGFTQDGATLLYGVGAVKTVDLMGLFSERLKTSFLGRIQAFFSYLYGKSADANAHHD
jgi:hypothetical protein